MAKFNINGSVSNKTPGSIFSATKVINTASDTLSDAYPFGPSSVYPISNLDIQLRIGENISTPSSVIWTQNTVGVSGTTHTLYFKVYALSANGWYSVASTEVNSGVVKIDDTWTLSWNAVSGASGYKVFMGTATGAENQSVTVTATSVTSAASFAADTLPALASCTVDIYRSLDGIVWDSTKLQTLTMTPVLGVMTATITQISADYGMWFKATNLVNGCTYIPLVLDLQAL